MEADTSRGNVSFTGLDVATTENTPNTAILTGDNTLMMIPQSFDDDDQKITILFTDGNSVQHSVSCTLNGTSWTQGQCITYTITTDGLVWEYVLEVTGGGDTEYTGGSLDFDVKSYRYRKTNPSEIEPVPWTIDGYKENGASSFSETKPSWIAISDVSGTGTTTTSEVNAVTATIAAQTISSAKPQFTETERGTEVEPYDLSTKGGTTLRNTANCYVVNAPGWYKLPLVYGNSIKNGTLNTAAYTSTGMLDYNDYRISSLTGPYLKYSASRLSRTIGDTPIVIWQETNGLVTNLSVDKSTDNGYLIFYVDGTKITESNAVIAVKDNSGVIMWSWHIWISAAPIESTIQITAADNSHKYNVMPVLLGYTAISNISTYTKRKVCARLKTNKKSVEVVLCQNPYTPIPTSGIGTCPYYQWGRKDPFIPWNGDLSSNNPKTVYGTYTTFQKTPTRQTLGGGIRSPQLFVYYVADASIRNYKWTSTAYVDLWNAGAANSYYLNSGSSNYANTKKSIYDPCPVGFKVAPGMAFSGLSFKSGSSEGITVYTNSAHTNTLYLPLPGYRHYQNGDIINIGTHELMWTALPADNTFCASIYNGYTSTSYTASIAHAGNDYGLVVLPVQE